MAGESFLASGDYLLGPVEWGEDAAGPYWRAAYFSRATGTRKGFTGSYYDTAGGGTRPGRGEQEDELRRLLERMGI